MTPAELKDRVFAFEKSRCQGGGDMGCGEPATVLVDYHLWKRLTCFCQSCTDWYIRYGHRVHIPDPHDDRYELVGVNAYGIPNQPMSDAERAWLAPRPGDL